MVWAIHDFHRGLNLNFAFGWSLGKDPKWLCPRAITGSCESMLRFLSSAAFSAHNNFVFTPRLPFGSEPSLGSNIREGCKTAELTRNTSCRVVSYHGSVAPRCISLTGFKPYKWDLYLSVTDLTVSTVTHPHRNLQDQAMTEWQNHSGWKTP